MCNVGGERHVKRQFLYTYDKGFTGCFLSKWEALRDVREDVKSKT